MKNEATDKRWEKEREELLAEIARLRGIIRAMARIGKKNRQFTPQYMIREWK
jgi:hypothetical protein